MTKKTIVIEFNADDEEKCAAIAHDFCTWMCDGGGEQGLMDSCEYHVFDSNKEYLKLNYHGNKKNPTGDDFMCDDTIRIFHRTK